MACRQFEKGSPVNPGEHEHVGIWLITSHLAFCPHVPGHGSRHLLRIQAWSRLHSVLSTHSGRQASYGLPTYSGEHSHTPPDLDNREKLLSITEYKSLYEYYKYLTIASMGKSFSGNRMLHLRSIRHN